jgi:predicted nuclease with RNAse H fold
LVAVDWSAARHEQRHLWVAEFAAAGDRVDRLAPATRSGAADRLITLAGADPALVVGLDFGFSLPAWWLDRCGIAGPGELWSDTGRLESWLRDCPSPFWGRPGRPRPALDDETAHWRRVERSMTPRPRSVFQIGGAGAVGTASLRGMPVLRRLRAAGFSVWPFDPWVLPVVAEVWPRLAIGRTVKSRADQRAAWLQARAGRIPAVHMAAAVGSDDAFDAVAAALALADRNGTRRPTTGDAVVLREGWVDGVALPPG